VHPPEKILAMPMMNAPTKSLRTVCLRQFEGVMGKTISAYILQKYNSYNNGQLQQSSTKPWKVVIAKYSNKLKQFINASLKTHLTTMKIQDCLLEIKITINDNYQR